MIIPVAGHTYTKICMIKSVDTGAILAEDAWRHGLIRHYQYVQRRKAYCSTDILVDGQLKPLQKGLGFRV